MTVGSERNRTGFSHTVHADNCNLRPNGSCDKTYPSYTSRDYSAVIYLNSDFNGGEFVFVSDYRGDEIQVGIIKFGEIFKYVFTIIFSIQKQMYKCFW